MTDPSAREATGSAYRIGRLRPPHAEGVTRMVREVYGDSYYATFLYDPEQIIRRNEAEELVSVVALDGSGQVVGHYALERPPQGAVAEASDALVLPEHRHHHLMEEMRIRLREEAIRLGLVGLAGYAVTNHVFSQRADEHIGARPCGVALGLWPQTFHNMPEPLPQRMSFVIYFRYLRPPAEVHHVATPHDDMLRRIHEQFGIPVRLHEAGRAEGPGDMSLELEVAVQAGSIQVHRVGADTAEAVCRARRELAAVGLKAMTLELPLAQPGTAELCHAAEEDGFFFCGLGPAFARDGDALVLQFLAEDLDVSLVQTDSPFTRDLLAYVARERERVRSGRFH
jgi:hypothetical protein